MGEAGWVHAVVGRKVSTDAIRRQSSPFFRRQFRGIGARGLVFSVVDSNHAVESIRGGCNTVAWRRPVAAFAETWLGALVLHQTINHGWSIEQRQECCLDRLVVVGNWVGPRFSRCRLMRSSWRNAIQATAGKLDVESEKQNHDLPHPSDVEVRVGGDRRQRSREGRNVLSR